jgi:hypothetical protein
MALFSNYPPGEQIKRWVTILTALIIVIDCIAAGSLLVVNRLMNDIVRRYEPLVVYSGDIAASVHQVRTGFYQYLGEFRPDTLQLQADVQSLRETIQKATKLEAAADLGTDLTELDVTLEKYQKVVQLLPKIGSVTNWGEVEELRNQAIALSDKVEQSATLMKEHSKEKIGEKAARSEKIASAAMYTFIGFFALSIVIVVLLFFWWREFQEAILSL